MRSNAKAEQISRQNYSTQRWSLWALLCNPAERAIRPAVIGRKNYLFAGSHKGAENAAIIYSLIETCKALKIEPFWYLKDVLERLPSTMMSQIRDFLPTYWKSAQDQVVALDAMV